MERHHAAKKDAPSGTAHAFSRSTSHARAASGSVPIVSLRQGGQPGEHSVFFEGRGRDGGARPPRPVAFDLRAGRRARRGVDARVGPHGPGDLRRFLRRPVAQRGRLMMASAHAPGLFTFEESSSSPASSPPSSRRFTTTARVDEAGLRRLARRQIAGGVAGLVPCGTTGEAVTLDADEHERVVAVVVEEARASSRRVTRDRGLRLERHPKIPGPRRTVPPGRCRRAPRRHALLQQAHAERPRRALLGRRRRGPAAARSLQRAGPDRPQHAARHRARAREGPAHRGREGSLGQPRPGLRDPPRAARADSPSSPARTRSRFRWSPAAQTA